MVIGLAITSSAIHLRLLLLMSILFFVLRALRGTSYGIFFLDSSVESFTNNYRISWGCVCLG